MLFTYSSASFGLDPRRQQTDTATSENDEPVRRLDGYLLLEELTALLKDEVAPLRLASLARPERGDQHALRVREQRVREFLLRQSSVSGGGEKGQVTP